MHMGIMNVGPYLGRIRHTGGLEFKHFSLVVFLTVGVLFTAVTLSGDCVAQAVSGAVRDDSGNIVGDATIRVKTTKIATRCSKDGHFVLSGFVPSDTIGVAAWENDYYVAGGNVESSDTVVHLALNSCNLRDNEHYTWVPPSIESRSAFEGFLVQTSLDVAARISVERLFFPLAHHLALGCRDCHREIHDQWAGSSHALGTKNVRFLTMYNGTDVFGNQSPETQYSYRGNCRILEDYGLIGQYVEIGRPSRQVQICRRNYGAPLRPNPDLAYYGPGYKLDFPQTRGNCGACHLPSAAIEKPYGVDPNQVTGIDAQGSHCDLCHKIAAVKLDPATGLPYESMPGILSMRFERPGPDSQLLFGRCEDVDVTPHNNPPLIRESKICAPCHQASFWGVSVFESFAEWLASPYPAQGKTCQSCHMKPNRVMTKLSPGRGGLKRNPETVSAHDFLGVADDELLQNALTLDVRANFQDGQVEVGVTITNDRTGHHVPTGSPLRHLILLVEVTNPDQVPLACLDGPTVPDWCGVGDRAEACYGGLPGKAYAKVLQEWWTELAPTGAYWNKTRLLSDNRIAALAADTSRFIFDAADHEEVTVNVELLYRRAFASLLRQKGWEDPDIVLGQRTQAVRQLHSLHASREGDSR
jgi:hypothetical protein